MQSASLKPYTTSYITILLPILYCIGPQQQECETLVLDFRSLACVCPQISDCTTQIALEFQFPLKVCWPAESIVPRDITPLVKPEVVHSVLTFLNLPEHFDI